jgi:hypothetical protein
MASGDLRAARDDPTSVAAGLSEILQESLKALAAAGQADMACRLAGRACAVLRTKNPEQWGRFNKLLHRLGPMTGAVGTPRPTAVDGSHQIGPIGARRTGKAVR